ncbi:MAG: hypothetical protein MJ152_03245 [Clostridia bacterium]|nr:hypothetical protein [Clostridia bacterium]
MATSTEEFENKCMDIIEKIVSIDVRQDRKGAITVAEKMLAKAKEKTTNAEVISIYERVLKEFNIATDTEYELLRKQIFS